MPPPRYADGIPLRRPGSLSTGNLPPPTNCNATETLHPRAHQNPQDYSASGNKVLLFFEPEVLSFQNNLSNQKKWFADQIVSFASPAGPIFSRW